MYLVAMIRHVAPGNLKDSYPACVPLVPGVHKTGVSLGEFGFKPMGADGKQFVVHVRQGQDGEWQFVVWYPGWGGTPEENDWGVVEGNDDAEIVKTPPFSGN